MIGCEEFLSHISELIDREIGDELDAERHEAMAEHSQQCRRCHVVLETTRQMIRLVGDPALFDLPAEVSQRLHTAIELRLQRDAVRVQPPATGTFETGRVIDLPLQPQVLKRPWWSSPRLAFAAAVLLLALVAGGYWMGNARTVYVAGWLTDAHCYATFREHPQEHPRACMLAAGCQESGFGVINAKGNFLPFDQGATKTVVKLLEANSSPDHIWVRASGREHDGVLHVRDMQIRTPDERVAQSSGTAPPQPDALAAILAQAGWF